MEKGKSKIGVVILCIAMLLVGVGGTYLFLNSNSKLITKTTATKEEKKEEKKEELYEYKTTSPFITGLIERYDYSGMTNVEIFERYYSKDEVKVTDIDKNYIKILIAIAANQGIVYPSFTSEQFQNAKTMLFGNGITIEDSDIDVGCGNAIKYYSDNKTYIYYTSGGGCGGTTVQSMLRKITGVKNNGDTLEVTVSAAIANAVTKKVYKDSANTQEIVGVTLSENYTIADADYDKLLKFTYYFSYDKENNNYYLTTIKKQHKSRVN